ncbi:MAG: hypothetical protein KIH69_022165 [Anaerolineae bacterium]|nr:hypothetical protein [Anaerolineae bacterium]
MNKTIILNDTQLDSITGGTYGNYSGNCKPKSTRTCGTSSTPRYTCRTNPCTPPKTCTPKTTPPTVTVTPPPPPAGDNQGGDQE